MAGPGQPCRSGLAFTNPHPLQKPPTPLDLYPPATAAELNLGTPHVTFVLPYPANTLNVISLTQKSLDGQ